MSKISKHFKEKKNYYILSGILIFVFALLYIVLGAFPFGEKTIAHYDLYAQICTFMGFIFDAINGKSTLVFSNYIAGGANILGYITYFIFSPFYLLLLPFGKNGVFDAINVVLVLQEVAIGVSFLWFIRKYFRLSDTMQILLAGLYAFSPYIFFCYTWFSWLYIYMLLPIFAHTFIKLLKTGKSHGFVYVVTSMIYACYGVGLFSQIVLFVLAIVFIFLMINDKEKRKKIVSKLLLYYGMAVVLSLPLLMTSFAQLLEGSRLGNITDSILHKDLVSASIWAWVMFLMFDICSLIFAIRYMVGCDKKKPFNKFLIVALTLNLAPVLFDGILLVLSMGNYYGYVPRMGYILTFFILISVILYVRDVERKSNAVVSSAKIKKTNISLMSVLGVCAIGYMIAIYPSMSVWIGNLTTPFTVCLVYGAIPLLLGFGLVYVDNRRKDGLMGLKLWRVLVVALCAVQVVVNLPLCTGETAVDRSGILYLQDLSTKLGEEYEYRLKDLDMTLGINESMTVGFSSLAGFSSCINGKAVDMNDMLGYYSSGNSINSYGGTVLSDAFLGYKYGYSSHVQDFPWLKVIETWEYDGQQYYLYENTLSLCHGVLVDNDKELTLSKDICASTQNLYEYLGGSGEVARSTKEYAIEGSQNIDTPLGAKVSFDLYGDGIKWVEIDVDASDYNKVVYAVINVDGSSPILLDYNAEDANATYMSADTLIPLGYLAKGGKSIKREFYIEAKPEATVSLLEVNYDMIEGLLQSIQDKTVDVEYVANGFNIKTTANNQKLVVTNINIKGYQFSLNGNAIEANDCGFIEINLLDGENEVVAKYEYPYSKILILSLILVVLGMVALVLVYNWINKSKKLLNICYFAGMGLFVVFLAYTYFMPSLIFVVRLCLFKF